MHPARIHRAGQEQGSLRPDPQLPARQRLPRQEGDPRLPARRQGLARLRDPARMDQHLLPGGGARSEEHTSELQSLMRISYAVFCLKKKKTTRSKSKQTNKEKIETKNTRQ